MSTLLVVSSALVIALFFTAYAGGMFMFRECQEVDHDRHANHAS